jgi:hypothetical protein
MIYCMKYDMFICKGMSEINSRTTMNNDTNTNMTKQIDRNIL